jgi:hypothetical protein
MAEKKVKKAFTGMAGSSFDSHEAEPRTSVSYTGISVFTEPKRTEAL